MDKLLSRLWISTLLIPLLLVNTKQDVISPAVGQVNNFAFIENQLLMSSRYTQMEETNPTILNRFTDQFQLRYSASQLDELGFEKRLENNDYRLYFEQDSFSVIIEDKSTGYMFSSRPEFQGYSQTREDNTANRNLMNSGLWIESIRAANVSSSAVKVESLYTLAGVSYVTSGAQDLSAIDWTLPYQLAPNSYKRNLVSVSLIPIDATRFRTEIELREYGFNFSVELFLNDQGFGVYFNPETVNETNPIYQILGLQFFPYFGSTREDIFPGYMVIPDGVGALIRTNQRYDTSFQADYYGSDPGYLKTSIADLSLPVYGLIHQPQAFGFFNEIIHGAEHATLLAQFWGRSTRYQRITNRYNLRRIYRNIINRAGDGLDVVPGELNLTPYQNQYHLLTGEDAHYVGIARRYQQQLVQRAILSRKEPTVAPLHLAMIVHEQEPTFFGTSRITLTNFSQVQTMSETLKNQGMNEQLLVLKGWSNDGLSYRQPYRLNLSNRQEFNQLVDYANASGFPLYLEQDYLLSSELSSRVNFNQDVARNYSKLKMANPLNRLDNQPIDQYFLYPKIADQKLANDLATFNAWGISGLAMPEIGQNLYSVYDDSRRSRTETQTYVTTMLDRLSDVALHQPYAYALKQTAHYLDMPVTNSQLDLYTDLIPFVPYILKGYIPAYTPYLNFNALGKTRLLQMIDFGIHPSYILTDAPSAQLRYTYSNRYYTTAFTDFEQDIQNVYQYIASALNPTMGLRVVSRTMIDVGVSQIRYEDGTTLYVNYRTTDYLTQDGPVNALDYKVVNV